MDMPKILIERDADGSSEYSGSVRPADGSWIVLVRRDTGEPELFKNGMATTARLASAAAKMRCSSCKGSGQSAGQTGTRCQDCKGTGIRLQAR